MRFFVFLASIIILLSLAITIKGSFVVFVLAVLIGFLCLSEHLDIGLYILVFLAPMMHWNFRLSYFRFVLESVAPQWLSFYAPMVDVWAIILLIAFFIHLIRSWLKGDYVVIRMPGVFWYSLFLFSAVVSLIHVFPWELTSSIKYIIRYPLFVYIGYVCLGSNIITNKMILRRAMQVFICSAIFGALMGLMSLVLGVWGLAGLHRAVPFAMFGFAPFGDQHIFLAEILTISFPMIVYFWFHESDLMKKRIYGFVGFLTLFVTLMTFSRAGWLTLFMEVVLFVYFMRSYIRWRHIRQWIFLLLLALLPFVGYMIVFLSTKVVYFSNAARFALTDIAWFLFREHPFIGQGVGTFVARVSEISYFVYEFGTPIDAHSILDKLIAEQGLFGLTTFALFIGWICLHLYRRMNGFRFQEHRHTITLLLWIVLCSALFFQLFSTQYYSAKMWVPIMLVISHLSLYTHDIRDHAPLAHFRPHKHKIDTKA